MAAFTHEGGGARGGFSTAGLPARDQFPAWEAQVRGVFGCRPPERARRSGGFRAEQAAWLCGPLALRRARAEAAETFRTRLMARRDGLDHWVLATFLSGSCDTVFPDSPLRVSPGGVVVHNLQRPVEMARGDSEWLMLVVPRDAMPEGSAALDAAEGGVATGPVWSLLRAHMLGLAEALPEAADPAQRARLADATLDLLRAAATGHRDDLARASGPLEAGLRHRVLGAVRANLASVRLGPERLAELTGVSPARLRRLFAAEGGPAQAVRRERLAAARRLLSDPRDRRPVWEIAERCGLPDASAFGRAFRREFGLAPGEFREAARRGLAPAPSRPAPDSFAEALRRLGL